ncbi:MAG: hypothetical protein PW789_07645 [Edaphobacter sp.]|uniref:hypothetical protein n=1 Tax=Edaphobacter sp. TaxID=1934404 RepID=UPI00238D897F|nr:hypothetical protein [Edaphobacter sp.]MDE1176468.1 hypothetical protein [Edaphobacter sp.]
MKKLTVFAMYSALTLGSFYAQAQTADAGCTIDRGQATCNWTAFRKALDAARTVKPEYRDRDKSTGMQLKELAQKLGKSIANEGATPDLTMTVIPAAASGVDIGPADQEILELHIYAGDSSQQKLIWVETYIGQKDRPWPANVHSTIAQFQQRLSKK